MKRLRRTAPRPLRRRRPRSAGGPAALVAALLVLPLGASCVALAAAGAGAAATYGYISYKNNAATADYDRSLEMTWKAAIHALRAQDYELALEPELGPKGGEIQAGSAVVTIERLVGDVTRVGVRVGTFDSDDNRRLAMLLLEEIGRRLGR